MLQASTAANNAANEAESRLEQVRRQAEQQNIGCGPISDPLRIPVLPSTPRSAKMVQAAEVEAAHARVEASRAAAAFYRFREEHQRVEYGLSVDLYSFGLVLWCVDSHYRPSADVFMQGNHDAPGALEWGR